METTKKFTSYQDLKRTHAEELNAFEGIFFAFSDEQFTEGMAKIGYTDQENLKDKILSLGAGGYIRKDRSAAFGAMFDRHAEERKQIKAEEKILLEALTYELQNHEYCITGDTSDALNALGYTREEIPADILRKACRAAL